MAVISISARIECDSCGKVFAVDLDPADQPPRSWSLWDVAQNAVRGGSETTSVLDRTSVQDGQMLCANCTREKDGQAGEDEAALGVATRLSRAAHR